MRAQSSRLHSLDDEVMRVVMHHNALTTFGSHTYVHGHKPCIDQITPDRTMQKGFLSQYAPSSSLIVSLLAVRILWEDLLVTARRQSNVYYYLLGSQFLSTRLRKETRVCFSDRFVESAATKMVSLS